MRAETTFAVKPRRLWISWRWNHKSCCFHNKLGVKWWECVLYLTLFNYPHQTWGFTLGFTTVLPAMTHLGMFTKNTFTRSGLLTSTILLRMRRTRRTLRDSNMAMENPPLILADFPMKPSIYSGGFPAMFDDTRGWIVKSQSSLHWARSCSRTSGDFSILFKKRSILRFPAAFQRRPWSPMHIHTICISWNMGMCTHVYIYMNDMICIYIYIYKMKWYDMIWYDIYICKYTLYKLYIYIYYMNMYIHN